MKRIKEGEYKSALCRWCDSKAVWRSSGLGLNSYACLDHQTDLRDLEKQFEDEPSEADYQTWMRL